MNPYALGVSTERTPRNITHPRLSRYVGLWPVRQILRRKQNVGVQDNNGRAEKSPNPTFLTHSGHRSGCQFALQQTCGRLFDDFIGAHKQALRNFEAERLCCLEVDDKLELGRLHDR
jgi:hypothetical protein